MKTIPLTQGKITLIDNKNFNGFSRHKWRTQKGRHTFYAAREVNKNGKRKSVYMHREVLGLKFGDGIKSDHKDGDGLNSRRENLRICTNSQNLQNRGRQKNNTSGFTGVHFHKATNRWQAYITINQKRIHLGLFDTAIKAARAYNKKARELFGEFAKTNFD